MLNKADKVLKEIEKVAGQLGSGLPIIGKEKGSVLERVVKEKRPTLVLEIGTLVGYSAIMMAKNMKKGRIVSIEINRKNHEAAKANIERAGLSNKVKLLCGDVLEEISLLEGPFDLVFIDAKKEDYMKYLKAAEPKMTRNAIVIADNAKKFAPQMDDFLEYVRRSGKYKSELHDFGFDGVEVSVRVK